MYSGGLVAKVGHKKRKTMMWRPSVKICLSADMELAGNECVLAVSSSWSKNP